MTQYALTVTQTDNLALSTQNGFTQVVPVALTGGSGAVIVANIAALEALPTTGYVQGQPVIVQSVNALWTLEPASTLTPDGITVVGAVGGGNWLRGTSLATEQYQQQTVWFVDIANESGTASDENNGLTAATALIHKAEIARRWGTWSPVLSGSAFSIQYLSSDRNDLDPGLFAPKFVNGATLTHSGGATPGSLPPSAFTGTINVITNVVAASNQLTEASFNSGTGTMAQGLLLVNTTRANSIAWVQRSGGEGTWQLSFPMTPYAGSGSPGTDTGVTTWAAGDAIVGYSLLLVNLATIGGQVVDYPAGLTGAHIVWRISLWDPVSSADNGDPLLLAQECQPQICECSIGRSVVSTGTSPGDSFLSNCALNGAQTLVSAIAQGGGGTFIVGGYIASQTALVLRGCELGIGVILEMDGAFAERCTFTSVALDAGALLNLTDWNQAGQIYGPGILNASSGTVAFGGTAVSTFPVGNTGAAGGGMQLNGKTTGYSNVTAAGTVTVHGAILLNPVNIDAASGGGGFGGYAYGGGATYSKAGAQP